MASGPPARAGPHGAMAALYAVKSQGDTAPPVVVMRLGLFRSALLDHEPGR